jgi:hypothetical protein
MIGMKLRSDGSSTTVARVLAIPATHQRAVEKLFKANGKTGIRAFQSKRELVDDTVIEGQRRGISAGL